MCAVHVVLVVFVFLVYVASKDLGSPGDVYRKLSAISSHDRICTSPISYSNQACGTVNGNHGGSYLTMLSSGGLVFGIINIIGNFGTVFVDNVSLKLPSDTFHDCLIAACLYSSPSSPRRCLRSVSFNTF